MSFETRPVGGKSVVGYSSGAQNAAAEKREQPIGVAWSVVEEQTERISALVEKLFNRLRPILTPQDGAEESGKPPQAIVSPMAESFDTIATNLGLSAEAIERLLRQIEL